MAKDKDLSAKFANELFPGELIRESFERVTCRFDTSQELPAYVAITDRRLLVINKRGFGHRSIAVELAQIVEVVAGGSFIPTLTLGTIGGQRILFTSIMKDKIPVIQQAIGMARSR